MAAISDTESILRHGQPLDANILFFMRSENEVLRRLKRLRRRLSKHGMVLSMKLLPDGRVVCGKVQRRGRSSHCSFREAYILDGDTDLSSPEVLKTLEKLKIKSGSRRVKSDPKAIDELPSLIDLHGTERRSKRRLKVKVPCGPERTGPVSASPGNKLRSAFEDIQKVIGGILSSTDQTATAENQLLTLMKRIDREDGVEDTRSSRRNIRHGLEKAMLMLAYRTTGVADISAFFYAIGLEDPKLLARLSSSIMPRHISATLTPTVSPTTEIHIKPFVVSDQNVSGEFKGSDKIIDLDDCSVINRSEVDSGSDEQSE